MLYSGIDAIVGFLQLRMRCTRASSKNLIGCYGVLVLSGVITFTVYSRTVETSLKGGIYHNCINSQVEYEVHATFPILVMSMIMIVYCVRSK